MLSLVWLISQLNLNQIWWWIYWQKATFYVHWMVPSMCWHALLDHQYNAQPSCMHPPTCTHQPGNWMISFPNGEIYHRSDVLWDPPVHIFDICLGGLTESPGDICLSNIQHCSICGYMLVEWKPNILTKIWSYSPPFYLCNSINYIQFGSYLTDIQS